MLTQTPFRSHERAAGHSGDPLGVDALSLCRIDDSGDSHGPNLDIGKGWVRPNTSAEHRQA